MADAPESPMLVPLRRIDERTGRMAQDLHDLKVRVTAIEDGFAGVYRRMDRFEQRLERVERRLEPSDA
ncbi:hypothetical protein PQJ75_17290 [Rhodoplanes sp. TEM]|uniref:Uncharacterized protein n=1 Tax=Rhodoplanes tepidamans TaxID=200616 RepID=A0ABT5JA11_RHOTP|nr:MULTISPECIES: hypothetical protein [Rhodoplanes]MDC7786490.1 hypothetical protein [Rhodoplanes tepidamans]MDC7985489.1 hypothetical protein [Rhodoplanes sp. TEM]MDQ0357375.1 hypothetical protein [Rhodoplanes tepidamans]